VSKYTVSRTKDVLKTTENLFSHQDIEKSCKQHKIALTIPKRAIQKVRHKTHSALNGMQGNSLSSCRGFRKGHCHHADAKYGYNNINVEVDGQGRAPVATYRCTYALHGMHASSLGSGFLNQKFQVLDLLQPSHSLPVHV
jgi:hypothetical protein